MPDWSSPAEIANDLAVFQKLLIGSLGLYIWETIVTLWFDLEVVTGKRKFKWPMGFYWLCKYSMFWANIGVTIANNVTTEINCEALYVFNQLTGNAAIGAASTLLMFRAIAIWSRHPYVLYPFIILNLGQWALLLHSVVTLRASWSAAANACVIVAAPPINLNLLYLWTMAFDFLVMVMSFIGLLRMPGHVGLKGGGLWNLLIRDGLAFFLVAFSCNLIAAILALSNLNPIMNIITSLPAASITACMACRLFVRLSTFNDSSAGTFQNTSAGRLKPTTKGTAATGQTVRRPDPYATKQGVTSSNGVHVQMDTFVTGTGGNRFAASNVSFENGVQDLESQHEKSSLPYGEEYDDDKPAGKSFIPQ